MCESNHDPVPFQEPGRFRLLDRSLRVALLLLGITGAVVSVVIASYWDFVCVPPHYFGSRLWNSFPGKFCVFSALPIFVLFLLCAVGVLILRLSGKKDTTPWKPRRTLTVLTFICVCVSAACFLFVPLVAWGLGMIADGLNRVIFFF